MVIVSSADANAIDEIKEALLEAGSASIRLKNGQSIEITSTEISLKADASLSLEAAQIEIKGSGRASWTCFFV